MTKLREHAVTLAECVDRIADELRRELPDYGRDIAIDASDMSAYANGQRYLYNNGPERQVYSDPDASWGHRSAVSTRMGGGFYGYKLHLAACTRTGLPLAWQVETARRNESLYVAPLLDALHARGFAIETCAMDKGYDNKPGIRGDRRARSRSDHLPAQGSRDPADRDPLRNGRVEASLPGPLRRGARVRQAQARIRPRPAAHSRHRSCADSRRPHNARQAWPSARPSTGDTTRRLDWQRGCARRSDSFPARFAP